MKSHQPSKPPDPWQTQREGLRLEASSLEENPDLQDISVGEHGGVLNSHGR